MNRLVLYIILGTIVSLIHIPSFASLFPLSEYDMRAITGQAGVNVWIEDIEIWQHVGEAVYTDDDGYTDEHGIGLATDAASVVISDKEFTTNFRAITADTDKNGSLTRNFKELFSDLIYSPLKIDTTNKASMLTRIRIGREKIIFMNKYVADNYSTVASSQYDSYLGSLSAENLTNYNSLSESRKDQNRTRWITDNSHTINDSLKMSAKNSADYKAIENIAVSAVVATLPTLEIVKTAEIQTFKIRAPNSINNEKSFVTIENGPSIMAYLGGTIEITAH